MNYRLPLLMVALTLLPGCAGDGNFTFCGYTTKPNYDTEIKTVHVPIFQNRTFRQGLEFDLTKEVCRQIEQKTPYKVVGCGDNPDTELIGTISFADKRILNRNQLNEIREGETTLIVELVWRDVHTGEVLSKPKRDDEPLRQTPGMPMLSRHVGPDGQPIEGPPPVDAELQKYVITVSSLGTFVPELGESITTSHQKNVKRLATQIVSMMETPW